MEQVSVWGFCWSRVEAGVCVMTCFDLGKSCTPFFFIFLFKIILILAVGWQNDS